MQVFHCIFFTSFSPRTDVLTDGSENNYNFTLFFFFFFFCLTGRMRAQSILVPSADKLITFANNLDPDQAQQNV